MGKESKSTSVYANMAMFWFVNLTLGYTVIKYLVGGDNLRNTIWISIYFIAIISVMFFINNKTITTLCDGATDVKLMTFATLIPWIGILGITYLLINIYPGWKSPFSNTIGYALVYLAGAEQVMNEIIQPKYEQSLSDLENSQVTPNIKMTSRILGSIYENKSVLINEITPENYDTFWDQIKPLMIPGVHKNVALYNKLKGLIVLKDTIAECIWLLLSGVLAISVSYNYIITSPCRT